MKYLNLVFGCFVIFHLNLFAGSGQETKEKNIQEVVKKKNLLKKIVNAIEGEKQLFIAWDFADEDYYIPIAAQEKVMEFLAAQPLYLQDESEINSPDVILNKILKTTGDYLKSTKQQIALLEEQEKALKAPTTP